MKLRQVFLLSFFVPALAPAQDICLYTFQPDSSNMVMLCQAIPAASADFNHDGLDDLVFSGNQVNVSTQQTTYYSGIQLSNGDGTFTTSCSGLVNGGFYSAVTGDFNEDGNMDFAAYYASGHLEIALGDGNGCYSSSMMTVPSLMTKPETGDFDNDGHTDLMIGSINNNISVCFFHGNGNGTFSSPVTLLAPDVPWASNICAVDANNDGLTDIVYSKHVLFSNGGGSFTFVMPSMPNGFFSAVDINEDGFADVLSNDSVFLGSGYGNFPVKLSLNLGPGYTLLGKPLDLNNDHDPDLVAEKGDGQGMDTIWFFLGLPGTGFMLSQQFFPVEAGIGFQYGTSGDFDGNGLTDIEVKRDTSVFESCLTFFYPFMNGSSSIIMSSPAICQGDSILLSATPNSLYYNWSTGDTTASVYVSSAGTYSVTITSPAGCVSTSSVSVNTIAGVTFAPINSSGHFCLYISPFPLSSGVPAGGLYSGPGVSNGDFDPQAAGIGTHTLYYTYNGPGNCTGTDSLQVTVDLCIGTNDPAPGASLVVYPNPATDFIHISWPDAGGIHTAELYDALGNRVYQQNEFTGSDFSIPVSALAEGIYFLRIRSGDQTESRRIVIAR